MEPGEPKLRLGFDADREPREGHVPSRWRGPRVQSSNPRLASKDELPTHAKMYSDEHGIHRLAWAFGAASRGTGLLRPEIPWIRSGTVLLHYSAVEEARWPGHRLG